MKIRILFFVLLVFTCSVNKDIIAQESNVEKAGDFFQIALPVAAFASTIVWQGVDKPHWQFCKTMATSFVVTHALKRIIDKERPNGGRYSFPSGHTSAAFTGAAFLHLRYGWKVAVPSYALAGFVGWSRVYANKHDYWDLLGGAAIGVGSALLFTKKYTPKNMQVTLNATKELKLLTLAYTF
jgi:membrane-associated phospholipid phosphatase